MTGSSGNKYSYPDLGLPVSAETLAFRTICKVFQNDPIFGQAIKTWIVWDGSNIDDKEPGYNDCPFCRLSPAPMESGWITEIQHSSPLMIRVQLCVAGTNFDQIANLWGAFRNALWPQNNPTQRTIVETLIGKTRITRPTQMVAGYGSRVDDAGVKFMIADGMMKFGMLIGT